MTYFDRITASRDPVPAAFSILLVVLLTGCPDGYGGGAGDGNDEVGDGDSSTGGIGDDGNDGDGNGDGDGDGDGAVVGLDPEPKDPLTGGMASGCELGASQLWESTPPPASLGNGLVHDARLSLNKQVQQKPWLAATLNDGVPWSEFVNHYNSMAQFGFRPAQLRSVITVDPDAGELVTVKVNDRSVYVSDDDANYRTEVETYLFPDLDAEQAPGFFKPEQLGARPTSIESFALDDDDAGVSLGFSLAWVYDDNPVEWELRIGLSEAAMLAAVDDFAGQGYRPLSVSSRERAGVTEYSAIFVDDGVKLSDWNLSLGLAQAELGSEVQAASMHGLYPARVTAEQGSWSRLNVVWAKLPPGLAVEIRLDLTMATFKTEDAIRRSEGYHLETLDRYEDSGAERFVGVWLRYQPCLRWDGTLFEEGNPDYEVRYKMFHERTIATMDFVGTGKEGRLLRPSGTLHIFEADELVLNRAYTFAPSIYPDTPLDAPMKLASVSKSLTAAAVVREMYQRGLPLTTPYVEAAGIIGAPAAMNEVTVLDVLRNLGGFRAEYPVFLGKTSVSEANNPLSYFDHAIINASKYGAAPIDGPEMFDYAVLGGHLDMNDLESYWDSGRYDDSQMAGTMHYSNPGYSMLGELVSHLSGKPYEQYVLQHLAAPLDIQDRLFPDPGHRKDARGPTLAGLRCYLINADHPYRYDPDGPTGPVPPIFGVTALPVPHVKSPTFGDEMRWRKNQGPSDAAAPWFASVGRYSGKRYMGGALLPAGGWHADGASVGAMMRALNQTDLLLPSAVAEQLWSPKWKNDENWRSFGWSYGLGFYVRGNWVLWAGGTEGSMATVLHNRAYDFTIVHLTNVQGNGIDEFINPLMHSKDNTWGGSEVGKVFPCLDEADTPEDECNAPSFWVPY